MMKKITIISLLLNLFLSNQIYCQIIIPSNNELKGSIKSIKYQHFLLPNSNLLLTKEYRSIESFVATVDDYKRNKNGEDAISESNNKKKKGSIEEAAELMDEMSGQVDDLMYNSFLSTEYETVINYNSKGFKTQLVTKNINSHVLLKENFKYDTNNKLLNFTRFESKNQMDDFGNFDESEFVTIFTEDNYTYDSKGRISNKISTKSGLEDGKTIEHNIYNSNNQLITTRIEKEVNGEQVQKYTVDETKKKCTSKINSEGLTIKTCTGELNNFEETYDKKNRLVKLVDNNIFKKAITYQYLEDNLISETHYNEKKIAIIKVSNTYDDKSRLDGKIITYLEDGRKVYYSFKYDSKGNLYEISEDITKTSYKFDPKGNWILKIVKVEGKESVQITQRIISYY